MIRGQIHWGGYMGSTLVIQGHLDGGGYIVPDAKHVRYPCDHAMASNFNPKGWVYTLAYIQPLRLNTDQPVAFRVNGV